MKNKEILKKINTGREKINIKVVPNVNKLSFKRFMLRLSQQRYIG